MKKLQRIKTLYATGCSHTAGGGLDWPEAKEYYKGFNINYNDSKEVSYVRYLADLLQVDWINTAKSGTGLKRLLRKTWEYINEVGLEKSKETFFLLQINNPLFRMDFWCSDLQRYLVVNTRWDNEGNLEWIESKDTHPIASKPMEYFNHHTEQIKDYIEHYYDLQGEYDKLGMQLIGLLSYFERNNIEYLIEGTDGYIVEYLKRFIPLYRKRLIEIDGESALNLWAFKKGMLVIDETQGKAKDNHAGFFAQREWGSKLYEFIKNGV